MIEVEQPTEKIEVIQKSVKVKKGRVRSSYMISKNFQKVKKIIDKNLQETSATNLVIDNTKSPKLQKLKKQI